MSSISQKKISRREFLNRSGRVAAGIVATSTLYSCVSDRVGAVAERRIIGANDRINIAIIGIRSRGRKLAENFAGMPNVRVKTLCDIDENLYSKRVKLISGIQKSQPITENDLRRVFDDKDIDAVVVATPNHWHALAAIWACQAGKHVYVEKPCAHNIWEGRKIVEAAEKYGSIVAVGLQSRSHKNVQEAMEFIHSGGLGEVYMARGLSLKPRRSIGRYPDGPMRQGEFLRIGPGDGVKMPTYDLNYLKSVNYDMWQGPVREHPFNPNRFHYNWHWFWDYGNGEIGNQGPHQLDMARWGLNKDEHPVKIYSIGGDFVFDSDQQTPNTQTTVYKYADGKIMQFEVRGLYTNTEEKVGIGNFFYGSKGWMCIKDNTWQTYFGCDNEPGPGSSTAEEFANPMDPAGSGGIQHCENFISTLRSGNKQNLSCNIETGYVSTVLSLLGNISYRLGREVIFDGTKEKFVSDKEADRMLIDQYRKPYVVPEKV